MDLSHRSSLPEEMDSASTSADDYARCLSDLAKLNRVTFTHRPALRWLARATRHLPPGDGVSIVDVACGDGDLLRAVHAWAARRGLKATLEGVDLNPRAGQVAAAATPLEMEIVWRTGDLFDYDPLPPPDFIVSSQFAHHLTDAEVVRFLRWLDRHATRGWFVTDLHRHSLAYHGFPWLARVAGWHRIVRLDGQISIARGFRRPDWERLLAVAGVSAEVRSCFPFRHGIGRLK
jgi:2-polyprenyl-3-methyl-5-hydroxy-6-metoxy-1,4-benzoquinol methylase